MNKLLNSVYIHIPYIGNMYIYGGYILDWINK